MLTHLLPAFSSQLRPLTSETGRSPAMLSSVSPPAFVGSPLTNSNIISRRPTRHVAVCVASPALPSLPPNPSSIRAYLHNRRPNDASELPRLTALLEFPVLALSSVLLLLAARLGDADAIARLLKSGDLTLDVNVQDTEGSTAAMRASSRGHVDCLRLLLETGKVDTTLTNDWGYDVCIYVGTLTMSAYM